MKRTLAKGRSIESVIESRWQKKRRALIFSCGDGLFLILVGVAASLIMDLVHGLIMNFVDSRIWHLVLSLVVGMSFAAIVQTLLAFCVAPILGSIESKVPSMVAAMIIPMFICLLALVGINESLSGASALGAVGGIGIFILIQAFGYKCRKSLCCGFPQKEG